MVGKLGLTLAKVQRIQVAVVQAAALYGAGLCWDGQEERKTDIQKLVNRQARTITRVLLSTGLGPLIKEYGLRSADSALRFTAAQYTQSRSR
jgi:hypothetical protein